MPEPRCRFCSAPLRHTFVDLGVSPLCESYVSRERYNEAEPFYPLRAYVCASCYLVQIEALVAPDMIFTEYAYFSSYAATWVQHARRYADTVVERFGLDTTSFVVEVGSNDGYLLQHFVARAIPVLGIDPAANVAAVAVRDRNVPTLVKFFGVQAARELAEQGRRADLIVANNVLAQVPDLHDFVAGIEILLGPHGVATIEFPHLLRLMEQNQFDTIYHEHFSYFSLRTATRIFAHHGLRCFDVDELPTHGGSLRIYLCHDGDTTRPTSHTVSALEAHEIAAGLDHVDGYLAFGERVKATKWRVLDFLIDAKRRGKSVVGYGAPGKGNTLLNYCGVRTDFIDYTVDLNPYKQGKFLPGTRIPIDRPDQIAQTKPDYLFILPWNLKDEIMAQMQTIRDWGGQFVIPIPTLQVVP
jgi:C-methyltransferase C-terminal domain/Putative zinc binding domain/Methyltransferase domain